MGLLDLPAELLAQCFVYLDDENVFVARLSHRALDKASFAHFGKRFFRKKGFMITTPSLDVLQNIADHQELRKYVQHVWFNPDCYTFAHPECAFPNHEDEDLDDADELITPLEKRRSEMTQQARDILAQQCDAYRACMRDHNELISTSRLEEKLTSAFASLPTLETVGMRRSEDYSPYGWTILRDSIGEDPRVLGAMPSGPTFSLSAPTSLFVAIIRAVASTGVQLRRLYTDAVEIDNVKKRVLPPSNLEAACRSLWYVELNATKGWLIKRTGLKAGPPPDLNYTTLTDFDAYGRGLSRLFKAMPNLKEIGLQIFPDRRQNYPGASNRDSWVQSYPYLTLKRLSDDVVFPHLTRVKLENVIATSAILRKVLKPCAPRLTSLKLRDIRLLASAAEPRPWATFFDFLLSNCPELDYIVLYHLLYDQGGVSFVEFPTPALSQEHALAHLPISGGRPLFVTFDDITFEARGKEQVRNRIAELVGKHWYQNPLFSYAMDDDMWHTDTSDEEW